MRRHTREDITGYAVKDFARNLISKLVTYILNKDFEQDTNRIRESLYEIKRIINRSYDTKDVTIEELKTRLKALEDDAPWADDFEEPVATRLDFEDELFKFMSEIELCEEDKPLIRIATAHPAYKSFSRAYCMYEPEADELQIVRAFVRTMAPYMEEE